MQTLVFHDRAGGIFNAEMRDSRSPWSIRPPRPFITIARESCAGGSGLAQLLADRLNREPDRRANWNIFGGNVVNQMLETNHLAANLARFLPEDRVPEVNATIGEIVGLHPNLWELVQKTNATLRKLAAGGHVILVGRGANFATTGIPGGIHVRLVAPPANRARYFAERFQVTDSEALLQNARCDAARRRYVSSYFNADLDDPAHYDLVINTSRVPLAEAAELVLAHIHAGATAAA